MNNILKVNNLKRTWKEMGKSQILNDNLQLFNKYIPLSYTRKNDWQW